MKLVEANTVEAYRHLTVTLEEVPGELSFNGTARYVVRLSNASELPVPLDPCPAYMASFGESGIAVFHASLLNCADAPPVIEASKALRFEMNIDIAGGGIRPGFSGQLYWRLLSAPAAPGGYASVGPIPVVLSATVGTTVALAGPTLPPPDAARLFHTDGRTLGRGRFSFAGESGNWATFLEGTSDQRELRRVAMLDSGRLVCNSTGSISRLASSIHAGTCFAEPFALTFGVVPSDVTRAELTLAGAADISTVAAELAEPVDEPQIKAFFLVHSYRQSVFSITGHQVGGTTIKG